MKTICRIICFFLLLIVLGNTIGHISALGYDYTSGMEEIELPADMDFTVNKNCSGHLCFNQASAYEDGSFLIYALNIDEDGSSEENFERVYIDIYDANGHFVEEISFTTTVYFVAEMAETSVNIISYECMIVYDCTTKELRCYEISDNLDIGQVIQNLKEKTFISGEWEYRCVRSSFMGYKKLIRSNGNSEEVLIDLPGMKSVMDKTRIGGIAGFTIFVVGLMFIIVKKVKKNKPGKESDSDIS